MITRRKVLLGGLSTVAAGAVLARRGAADAQSNPMAGMQMPMPATPAPTVQATAPATPTGPHAAVVTPNGSTLPWRLVNGVKVFHLVAEPVHHDDRAGARDRGWGYNGGTPGSDDRSRRRRSRAASTSPIDSRSRRRVHWHGVLLPNGMDGVAGSHAARDPARRDVRLRVHAAAPGHVHVPPALRRDDPDGPRHDGDVHRASARAARPSCRIATSRSC